MESVRLPKILYILFYIGSLLTLIFYTANVPEATRVAQFYWILYITGLVIVLADVIIKNVSANVDLPDTRLWERPVFGDWTPILKKAFVVSVIILGLFVFFSIGSKNMASIVSAPKYQAVELNRGTSTLLSMASAPAEDLIFFVILMPTFISIFDALFKKKGLSVVLSILLVPAIFAGYHYLRYSDSQIAMWSVYKMGLLGTTTTYIFGNPMVVDAVHMANNGAIDFFSQVSINSMHYFYISAAVVLLLGGIWIFKDMRRHI